MRKKEENRKNEKAMKTKKKIRIIIENDKK